MKKVYDESVDVPDYALCYLINGDNSGLTDEDITIIDNWFNHYQKIADKYNSSVIISPEDYEEGTFTSFPAFGLACNAFPCRIIILADNNYHLK